MGWSEPSLPSIKATCDRCGETEDIEAYNSTSGHWIYPEPGERGSMGWDYVPLHDDAGGDVQLLCPACQEGGE